MESLPYGRICEQLSKVRRRCGTPEHVRRDWESDMSDVVNLLLNAVEGKNIIAPAFI